MLSEAAFYEPTCHRLDITSRCIDESTMVSRRISFGSNLFVEVIFSFF